MVIILKSNIPYLRHISGLYRIERKIALRNWLEEIGVKWNHDALVILNGNYCTGNEFLKDGDEIGLFIPISGG
ncbi:MoaD/ThiS family protein [Tepidibacillus marianensis]|uniref:MoaD/ThiS family protein n=1 Tax=Tepidibacillus marianensis TaxID=3131995 RepID=UPI0030D4B9D6